nr:MAG TPA: hypothetical protein [Caudoviricetes sp.]
MSKNPLFVRIRKMFLYGHSTSTCHFLYIYF